MKFDLVGTAINYGVFVASVTLHEAAHAWAAWRLGDDTAHRGGLVSLDPTPHIRRSVMGMVVVPIAAFLLQGWMLGWASTPYDRQWALAHPRRSALMGLAGPAANLLLAALAAGGILVGVACGALEVLAHPSWDQVAGALEGGAWPCAAYVLSIVFSLNLLLTLFNLMPVPPLDGASALMLVLPQAQAASYWAWTQRGQLAFIGLLLAWRGFDLVFVPVWKAAIGLLHG
jgi:Zn-dependent protease